MDGESDIYQFDVDTIKIVLAFLCTVLVALTIVGSPLSIILWVGLGYGLFRRDAAYVRSSTRAVQILTLLGGIGAVAFELFNSYWRGLDDIEPAGVFLAFFLVISIACITAVAVEFLWLKPLTRRLNQLAALGFGATSGLKSLVFGQRNPRIMPVRFPSSFSAADELAKWNDLRTSGAVTEEEFAAAKQRLLG